MLWKQAQHQQSGDPKKIEINVNLLGLFIIKQPQNNNRLNSRIDNNDDDDGHILNP